MCDALETKIPACFDGAIEFFEGCLKNEGKTIPRLVRDILKSFTRFVCESSGEQLLGLLYTFFSFSEYHKFSFQNWLTPAYTKSLKSPTS